VGEEAMEVYQYLHRGQRNQETRKQEEATQPWPSTWPNLSFLLKSLKKSITCLRITQAADGHKAIIRFKNGYGLEIFKYLEEDFFEMVVIGFPGDNIDDYEFATNTAIAHFNLGYSEEDIAKICVQVSKLK
jgi:hypothetical protein